MVEEIEALARKHAIKNAMDYGKADFGSVLSKVVPKAKELEIPMQELKKIVETTVKSVNSLKANELAKEYKQFEDEFEKSARLKAQESAGPKIKLDRKVIGEVITRFPPEPSGYSHIGQAKQLFLSKALAEHYNGKLFLYFDDTNPKKEKIEFVDALKEDLDWLGVKFDREYYASDNVEKIYRYTEKLIKDGNAYVCECSQEEIKAKRANGKECTHRQNEIFKNEDFFENMLDGEYAENTAVVRLKLDMKSPNAIMRDPTISRVITTPHYRQGDKYVVWPTYYLNTPILDSINGISDAIRDKDYELSSELYKTVLKMLGLRIPEVHLISRLKIKYNVTRKRVLRRMIEEKQLSGYDDPRLLTIRALRRRGILPKAIEEFVLRFGISKSESFVDISMLLDENKKFIEPIAKHLFYVEDPIKIRISNLKEKSVKLKLYPDGNEFRSYDIDDTFYLSKTDEIFFKNSEVIALKDFAKVKIESIDKNTINAKAVSSDSFDKIIQWVPKNHSANCKITVPGNPLNPDGSFNKESLKESIGSVEAYARQLNQGDIVQFERYGFCILDNKEKLEFIFISK